MSNFKKEEPTIHIGAFKSVVDLLRKNASNAFVSVREYRLNRLLDDSKVSTKYRGDIIDYLTNQGLLEIQGERAMMRYKFNEKDLKIDSLQLATEAYKKITSKPYVKKKQYRKIALAEEKVDVEVATITKKEYGLKDTVYFLHENIIIEGKIIASSFALEEDLGESANNEVEFIEKVNFNKTNFDIVVSINGPLKGKIFRYIDKSDIFTSIDILLAALKAKFHKANKIKTE